MEFILGIVSGVVILLIFRALEIREVDKFVAKLNWQLVLKPIRFGWRLLRWSTTAFVVAAGIGCGAIVPAVIKDIVSTRSTNGAFGVVAFVVQLFVVALMTRLVVRLFRTWRVSRFPDTVLVKTETQPAPAVLNSEK